MRIIMKTGDRKTARAYTDAAEQTGILRLCTFKSTAQVLERLFRGPFDALLSDDPSDMLPKIRKCRVLWPEYSFLLLEKPIETVYLPQTLTFCFSKDSDPKDVLLRISRFPKGTVQKPDADATISRFLQKAGVPVCLSGFAYMKTALRLLLAQRSPTDINTMNDIYEILSAVTGTGASVAEHAIRHAIDAAWMRADTVTLENLFGYTVRSDRGTPSNAAFLFRAADYIRIKEDGPGYDFERNA